MDAKERLFRSFLKSRGLRFTPERKRVLEEITRIGDHFEIEELWVNMYRRKRRVSKATLYRTVALLVACGILKEVITGERHAHYEIQYDRDHHDHLICIGCGSIIEFEKAEIEKLQNEVCARLRFRPISHKLEIRGYCEKCRPHEAT
jgi:Fur family ferric uptake transcriptional regulator